MPERKEILQDINILYVENEKDIRTFVHNSLEKIVKNIVTANNGLEGLEIFKQNNEDDTMNEFDLIITDISMPKMDGLTMLNKIKEIDSDISSIVTTAHDDSSFLKQAIEAGVRGYVMKPMNLYKLLDSIVTAAESRVLRRRLRVINTNLETVVIQRTQQLQDTIKKLEINSKELVYEATHDHLTSLYNRQKLNEELIKEIHRESRYKRGLSVIMFDIDYFKKINDTFGHDIGDDILIKIAKASNNNIREVDTLARWGGEEFILLLPETQIKDARRIANFIKEDISKIILPNQENVTASFGVTQLFENDTKNTFLKRVDVALYEAKENGRNNVVVK